MDDHKDDAMVALLPINSDWCKIDLPHLTLVYCGKIEELQATGFNALAKDAASIAMLTNPITLRVRGVEVFGSDDSERVDVLRMQPSPELLGMRHFLEDWDTGDSSRTARSDRWVRSFQTCRHTSPSIASWLRGAMKNSLSG
jgi:2'-5' RNA ligase